MPALLPRRSIVAVTARETLFACCLSDGLERCQGLYKKGGAAFVTPCALCLRVQAFQVVCRLRLWWFTHVEVEQCSVIASFVSEGLHNLGLARRLTPQ